MMTGRQWGARASRQIHPHPLSHRARRHVAHHHVKVAVRRQTCRPATGAVSLPRHFGAILACPPKAWRRRTHFEPSGGYSFPFASPDSAYFRVLPHFSGYFRFMGFMGLICENLCPSVAFHYAFCLGDFALTLIQAQKNPTESK
jgi:hypothetical protein